MRTKGLVWRDAKLDWQIRKVTKSIYPTPLDVIGQNIENIIDEGLIVRKLRNILINVYCNPDWLIIEDFIGMTPEDIEESYVTFGVSKKSKAMGRFGHGGKDSALNIAGKYFILSVTDEGSCGYELREEKTGKVRYRPVWEIMEKFPKKSKGTLTIVPNKRHLELNDIHEYVQNIVYLGLMNEKIQISTSENFGGRLRRVKPILPVNCKKIELLIRLNISDVEKFCTEPPLQTDPIIEGFYLTPSGKRTILEETGLNFFCHGKLLTSIVSPLGAIGFISIDFIVETNQLTAAKNLRMDKFSLYAKLVQPKLREWEKEHLEEELRLAEDEELLNEINALLGPLYGSKGRRKGKKKRKRKRQRKRPIVYKDTVGDKKGQTPGHGKITMINDPNQRLIMGILIPDNLFYNKGNKDGEYIWDLPRKEKKTLVYSRASIFLPHIVRSRSSTLTSEELEKIHKDALKSQEYWINAIRRDHGTLGDITYLGDKRLKITSKP